MSEPEKENQEVLLEKVRELEERRKKDERARENTAVLLGERSRLNEPLEDDEARRRMRAFSRRGFLIGGAAAVFGYLGYSWLRAPESASIFSGTFRFNEDLSQLYYSPKNLAAEYSPDQITPPRVNGAIGLDENFDPSNWRLHVFGLKGSPPYDTTPSSEADATPPKTGGELEILHPYFVRRGACNICLQPDTAL